MMTNSPNTCLGCTFLRLFFLLFLLLPIPCSLLAQSDKVFQLEVGAELYTELGSRRAAAGGLFIEGKYQNKQIDFGLKIGRPFVVYGTDESTFYYDVESFTVPQAYFSELPVYFEGSFNYKPNFKHAKPFFGIGYRYTIRKDREFEVIDAFKRTSFKQESPSYFVPVINLGYYYKDLKFQLNFVLSDKKRFKQDQFRIIAYAGYLNVGASYVFGLGERVSEPSYEMSFSQKTRAFRLLAFRLEAGFGHQVAFSNQGVGSTLLVFAEAKVRIAEHYRLGISARFHEGLGIDRNSQEIEIYAANKLLVRESNTASSMSSFILFGERVLKRTISKEVLVVGAGLGFYKIQQSVRLSYVDNGVRVEFPPQVKAARLPGLHLRVGQRFGAFTHSAFMDIMPGQMPVSFGIQLGLGLNIFGRKLEPPQ